MSKLLAIAEAVAFEKLVMGGMSLATRKTKAGYGFSAIAALLGLVAAGFLITAFYAWALIGYRSDIAALMTAGLAASLAAAAGIAAYVINHQRELKRQLQQESFKNDLITNVKAVINTIDEEFGDQVRENPATAILLAGLAGFIAADKVL